MQKEIDVVRRSALVEQEALRAGEFFLEGKRFENFDYNLLRVGDSSLSEHIDCQASGQLYYDMIVEKARRKLESAKNEYDSWHAEKYGKARDILVRKDPDHKPNIGDVEKKVVQLFPKGHKKRKTLIFDLQSAYNELQIWANAWRQKSFSLGQITGTRMEIDQLQKGGKEAKDFISSDGKIKK